MRFTEHELTTALTGAAKTVAAAKAGGVRRRAADPDEVWQSMEKYARYQVMAALGDELLPVMAALPDVEVEAGTRAAFSDEQILEAVHATIADGGLGRVKRKVVEASRVALTKVALEHLPVRRDPDALSFDEEFVVPDDLSGL
ncbi:MAG: hypothetical protein ACI379_08445 [Nocardioides sp.]|uniref:hypothetical protein n=1 Tax=Nocardioides sp. TaxID=35761 RepID=UPI003EFE4F82